MDADEFTSYVVHAARQLNGHVCSFVQIWELEKQELTSIITGCDSKEDRN